MISSLNEPYFTLITVSYTFMNHSGFEKPTHDQLSSDQSCYGAKEITIRAMYSIQFDPNT